MIELHIQNLNRRVQYPFGTTLQEICDDLNVQSTYPILGARVNNKLKEMSYKIFKPKQIRYIDIGDRDGFKMYVRSLIFVLIKAVNDTYPEGEVIVQHAVSKGLYCEIEGVGDEVTLDMTIKIVKRMREIIEADIPFTREEVLTTEAIKLFEQYNLREKAHLFKSRVRLFTSIYRLENQVDYFYGYLVPSTGFLKVFDLVKYYEGMLLMLPKKNSPGELEELILQNKLFEIFQEYKSWGEILGVESIGSINQAVMDGKAGELIKVAEALHEKKVSQIADRINSKRKKVRLILISGPSSSGKTTFSKRLAIQLKVLGIETVQISLDNYFVDRESTPKDENGEYNFEALEALDVKLFNENLVDLIDGKEVELPKFSFEEGKRFYNGEKLKIKENQLIVVEGIHGLNPKLTEMITPETKYKVYVSALTQMGIDRHNRIPTSDNRLLRRMVRDYKYRGYSALDTLKRWPSVGAGEKKYIFPFQEEADVMFNSALLFELGVIKNYAVPLLEEIQEIEESFSEATRLLKFLSYFKSIDPKEIPPTSILREFLEGSSFDYN